MPKEPDYHLKCIAASYTSDHFGFARQNCLPKRSSYLRAISLGEPGDRYSVSSTLLTQQSVLRSLKEITETSINIHHKKKMSVNTHKDAV